MCFKKYIILLLGLSLTKYGAAQEELGYINSNYAGVNSLFINPSFNVDSKIFIDAHLIGFEGFVHNNAGYFPKEGYSLIGAKFNNLTVDEIHNNKKLFAKLDVMGPSAAVSWDKHSFGFFTRYRSYLDAKMTRNLFVLALKDFDYPDFYGKSFNENAQASTISWFELGFSYGYMFEYSSFETIDAGINVKRLFGINAASVGLTRFDYSMNTKKDMDILDMKGGYRIGDAGWNIASGFGVDIGVNYQYKLENITGYSPNTKKGGCKHIDYKYKIGISLLDIGSFKIKKNAIRQDFEYKLQNFNFVNEEVKSISDFDRAINNNLTNNQVTQTRQTSYTAWLPFTLSLQGDYNFENHFFLNLTTFTSIKLPYQAKRIDVISITPRYERKYFEVALPISLIDYKYPQLGLALRLGNNLVIGTNRITSITGYVRDVYGIDLYFNLKFALYRKCSGRKTHYKKRTGNKCAAYN